MCGRGSLSRVLTNGKRESSCSTCTPIPLPLALSEDIHPVSGSYHHSFDISEDTLASLLFSYRIAHRVHIFSLVRALDDT